MVETSPRFPRTLGLPPEYPHAIHVDAIDVLVESDAEPFVLPEPEPGEIDAAIAAHARRFIADGSTLQTGIGDDPVGDRRPARRRRGRRLRRALGDVHQRPHAAARVRQGHEPQGPVRRRLGRHVRRRLGRALRVAGGQQGRRLPPGRGRQLARPDRPQPDDGDHQRRDGGRHPRAGGRRHDRRQPVLRDRRSRGLHRRPGALALGSRPAVPAVDRRDRRRGAVADRALVRARARSSPPRAIRST